MVDVSNELIDNKERFYGMAISTSEHNFGEECAQRMRAMQCHTTERREKITVNEKASG